MNACFGDLAGRGGFTHDYQSVILKRLAKASHLLRQPNRNGSHEDHVMAKRPLPSPEELRQRLSYNAATGSLTWKPIPLPLGDASAAKAFNARYADKVAGTLTEKGYFKVRWGAGKIYAHRIAWAIHYGEWPVGCIDHINHDGTDNRISNLRDVSRAENARNRPPQKNSKNFVGIYKHKTCSRWVASIGHKGENVYLGLYPCIGQAIKVRRTAEQIRGFHPHHGGVR